MKGDREMRICIFHLNVEWYVELYDWIYLLNGWFPLLAMCIKQCSWWMTTNPLVKFRYVRKAQSVTHRVIVMPYCAIDLTVYPKKYAHGFCFAVLCCGYTLTDFPISIRLTSLALWQSNDCPSANKATLMNMYRYFMWIHYERLHNHNKAKHNKTVCIFLGIYCRS